MTAPHYRLISFATCPFVQRSVIVLREKNVLFELESIDLRNKPQWFLELSPTGKVPVLVVDGETVLFESAVIAEYLDEVTGGGLLPRDPLARARARAWVEFGSVLIMELHGLSSAKEEAAARRSLQIVVGLLGRLEANLVGPLFLGEVLSLVDVAVAPALQRLHWVAELRPDFGIFDGVPKVARWRDAILARPSVVNSTLPDIREQVVARIRASDSWLGGSLA